MVAAVDTVLARCLLPVWPLAARRLTTVRDLDAYQANLGRCLARAPNARYVSDYKEPYRSARPRHPVLRRLRTRWRSGDQRLHVPSPGDPIALLCGGTPKPRGGVSARHADACRARAAAKRGAGAPGGKASARRASRSGASGLFSLPLDVLRKHIADTPAAAS